MWVFGYGSLIWKVDFPFEEKVVGYIEGFSRRFYQHSVDHRGVPEKPGRVVTLIQGEKTDQVWGIAYKIPEKEIDNVVNHLDYREKGGYKRCTVLFHAQDKTMEPFDITIYLATQDNVQFAGEADLDSIARQIYSSIGPSGTNIEYVCNLAKAMREIAPHVNDEHLFALEKKVLDLIKENS